MSGAGAQWVNLYRPPRERWAGSFRPNAMLWSLLAIGGGVLLLSGYVWRDVRLFERSTTQVLQEARGRSERLIELRNAFQSSGQLASLQQQVASLDTLASRLQLVLQQLGSAELGRREGFSAALAALGAARIDGVWVERVALSGTEGRLELRGHAQRADLLPDYLASLGRQRGLSRRGISDFAVETGAAEAAPAGGLVSFHISQAEDGAAAP